MDVKSCGVLVMRNEPKFSFLLMQNPNRYDLPKGHIEAGEDELTCALRELHEETGIPASAVDLDPDFRFTDNYQTSYKRYGGRKVDKTVVIFLGWLKEAVSVTVSEHSHFTWIDWQPPHGIQSKTIDPLLQAVERYFAEDSARMLNTKMRKS
ncbi:bis(5'-nucleosyl)-tetraphosphatase [Phormidium sp. CCY1219]|uniref:bis(5'-nucleosyl)-tetraphosphatase n=1 Tax=Phormidium sp. CCY1219 TaxID=2886104 RepID=UPI002D1F09E2|nr:NUDIX domain-containing protein [Phormidium sp. CCY1219]MEB3830478.1 NUDIX domain-containing protein [Phormidium sp. CCY1219]